MSACSVSGSYQVDAVLLAALPRLAGEALDRLQRDVALRAQRRELVERLARSAGPASGRSCTGTARSRSRSGRGCAGASSARESPWPVTPMKRTRPSSRASRHASSAPPGLSAMSHSITSTRLWSWIESTWSTPSRSSERRISSARRRVGALAGLGGQEELVLAQPGGDAQLRVAVAGGDVDVVDAVLEQQLERAVGVGLGDVAERRGTEDHAAGLVSGRAEGGALDHARSLRRIPCAEARLRRA